MSGLTKLESALADRFEILDQIGEGGMGLIFRARQRSLDRIVALKVASILNEGALKRFRLEVRALSLLNHPCIVRIFDADLEGETPYFVMECIVGQSLSALLKRGPLPVDLVMSIATAVADGLAHAHTLGIVHRDIKPDNILMTDSGLVKIADFGIAKWVKPVGSMSTLISRQDLLEPSSIDAAPVTCEGIIIGSPCYLSPEQISPDEGIGPATDIYSLGITLYEALTGQVPFGGDDVPRILRRHLIEPPAPARSLDRSIPPSLDALLGRMLEKTPRNRPQHGSALAAEIAGLGLDTRSGRLAVATTDRNASTDRITRAIDPSSGDEAAQIDRRTVAVRAGDDPKCAGPAPAPRRRLVSDHEPPVPRALRPTPARPFPVAPAVRARSPAGAGFRLVLAAAALALSLGGVVFTWREIDSRPLPEPPAPESPSPVAPADDGGTDPAQQDRRWEIDQLSERLKRPFRISIPEPSQRGVFLPVSTPNAADALLMPGPQESTQPSTSTLVDARACRVVPQKRVCFEIVMPPSPQEGYRISLETSGIASGVRLLCRVNGAARCSLTAKAHDRKTFALEVPAAWLVAGRNDFRFVQLDPASRAIEVASFVAEPLGPPPQVAPARRREPTIPARASAAFAAMNGSWTAGNLPDVLRRADEVLRAAPHFAPALARRAEALHRLGRWSQAIETFQEAIRYDLHDASLWDDLGMTLNDRGRLEEARRLLTHALRLAPDGYWHWHNLALVESRSGEPDAALRHLDLSLEIDPRGKESLADKAQIHQDRGETGLAREVWEQVLAIDPKHDRARNTLFKLDHAKPPE